MALIENKISKDLQESDFIGEIKCRFYYISLEVLLHKNGKFTMAHLFQINDQGTSLLDSLSIHSKFAVLYPEVF